MHRPGVRAPRIFAGPVVDELLIALLGARLIAQLYMDPVLVTAQMVSPPVATVSNRRIISDEAEPLGDR